jgi:hypothetical protein
LETGCSDHHGDGVRHITTDRNDGADPNEDQVLIADAAARLAAGDEVALVWDDLAKTIGRERARALWWKALSGLDGQAQT